MSASQELTEAQRALFAVIRQCTLIDEAKDRPERIRRAEKLVELSRVVLFKAMQP